MVTHREQNVLHCEVKQVLGRITINKAIGGDGIPAERLQILKLMLLKCCTHYTSKFGKLSKGHRTGKAQFTLQPQRKTMPKNVQTTAQLCSFHMLARQYSKSSTICELKTSRCTAGFRKGRGTRDQITNIHCIIEKAREFLKKIYFCFMTT